MSKQPTPELRAARAVARQAAERQRELENHFRSRWFTPWLPGALALLVVVGSLAFVLTSGGSDGSSKERARNAAAAQAWRDDVLVGLRPLTGNAVQLGRTMTDWQAGRITAAAAAGQLSVVADRLGEAQRAADAHAPLATAPRAIEDFRLTAGLYAASVDVARAATTVPDGPLRHQLQLQFARLRDLGDRWFDQGDVELSRLLGERKAVDGVEIRRTAEVPDWSSMGLAAGPPLDVVPAQSALREYQASRPSESFDAWRTNVHDLEVPSGTELSAALSATSVTALQGLARELVAASDALHSSPDPKGERAVSTRLQLGLLVDAEAMRASQASLLATGGARSALERLATDLVALAGPSWDARLGQQ